MRVVEYGLGEKQTKEKNYAGRIYPAEKDIKEMLIEFSISDLLENTTGEIMQMWLNHVDTPNTRRVFAAKGRRHVRLTIGEPDPDKGHCSKKLN